MSFTIRYCDIEPEHYVLILVNIYNKFAHGKLEVLDMIPKKIQYYW